MADGDKGETVTLTKKDLDQMLAKVASDAAKEAAKMAVQQATTEIVAGVTNKAGAAPDSDMFKRMGEAIALAIAEVSDQGTSRKRVAPEVLARRARAHQRMVELILAARERGEKPEYKLVAKVYLNERFIDPYMPGPNKQPIPTEIIWSGPPSMAMRPLNPVAEAIFTAFRESIGTEEPLKGMDNRPFYMTPGGVVVKGDPRPSKREIPAEFADDLKVLDNGDPTAPFVHVLGTVAAPARQNVVRRADQLL